MNIREELKSLNKEIETNLFTSGQEGYWSNLTKEENSILINAAKNIGAKEAIKKFQSNLFNIIYSPKRPAGLELLNINGNEKCIDYGCMWGVLTVALAGRSKYVLGIDQTLNSLKFLNERIKEEKIDNIDLLCANIKNINKYKNKFDIAIVNGVLEWIPEEGEIVLKSYYGKKHLKKYKNNPQKQQESFLSKVYENLDKNGRLYLAIENRFDFKLFLGSKDPHANISFVSFLPRKIAKLISLFKLKRPYINWIYSFRGIKKLLKTAGFTKTDLYMCFPDYRYPDKIIPYSKNLPYEYIANLIRIDRKSKSIKNIFKKIILLILRVLNKLGFFKIIRLNNFAPSIIAIGYK